MKKLSSIFALAIVASMLLNVSTYAVYDNGPRNTQYNRTNAQSYIGRYTTSPNPDYYYFNEGGDCTSFASQVLYAGGMSMTAAVDNPTDSSWYYYKPHGARSDIHVDLRSQFSNLLGRCKR